MAMMGGLGGTRTIWLAIRGTNYARQAMREAQSDLTKLQRAQERFRQQAQMMTFAGLLQVAMFGLLLAGLWRFASGTRYATRLLRGFNRTAKRFGDVFGLEVIKVLKPFLIILEDLMKYLMRNKVALQMLVRALIGLAIIGTITGLFKLLGGVIMMVHANLFGVSLQLTTVHFEMQGLNAAIAVHTINWANLGRAIWSALGPAMMIATILATLMPIFGKAGTIVIALTAIMLGLAVAIAAVRTAGGDLTAMAQFGIALAAGGALSAAYVASMPSMPSYQQGKETVTKTGLAMVHEGEKIITSTAPSGWFPSEPPETPKGDVNIITNIDNLHTKADEEELKDVIWKATKKAMDRGEYGD